MNALLILETHRKLKCLRSFEKSYNCIESLLSWTPFKKNLKKKNVSSLFFTKNNAAFEKCHLHSFLEVIASLKNTLLIPESPLV